MAMDIPPPPPAATVIEAQQTPLFPDALRSRPMLPDGATYSPELNTVIVSASKIHPSLGQKIGTGAKKLGIAVVNSLPVVGTTHEFFACRHDNKAAQKDMRNQIETLNSSIAPGMESTALSPDEIKDVLSGVPKQKCGLGALKGVGWDAVSFATAGGGTLAQTAIRMTIHSVPVAGAVSVFSSAKDAIKGEKPAAADDPNSAPNPVLFGKQGAYTFVREDGCFVKSAGAGPDACLAAGEARQQRLADEQKKLVEQDVPQGYPPNEDGYYPAAAEEAKQKAAMHAEIDPTRVPDASPPPASARQSRNYSSLKAHDASSSSATAAKTIRVAKSQDQTQGTRKRMSLAVAP